MPDGGNSIVVKVNNLCPDDGNPLCAQPESELFFCIFSFLMSFFLGGPLGTVIRVEELKDCEDYELTL